jgi:hypothetical protein
MTRRLQLPLGHRLTEPDVACQHRQMASTIFNRTVNVLVRHTM